MIFDDFSSSRGFPQANAGIIGKCVCLHNCEYMIPEIQEIGTFSEDINFSSIFPFMNLQR